MKVRAIADEKFGEGLYFCLKVCLPSRFASSAPWYVNVAGPASTGIEGKNRIEHAMTSSAGSL
jgi:hypothetical protein